MSEFIRVKLEGGRNNGVAMGAYPNVHTIVYGNKGSETVYKKTDRLDNKGRVIFAAA